jgi:hypothetical protein
MLSSRMYICAVAPGDLSAEVNCSSVVHFIVTLLTGPTVEESVTALNEPICVWLWAEMIQVRRENQAAKGNEREREAVHVL